MKYSETCGQCQSIFVIECLGSDTFIKACDNWRKNHKCTSAVRDLAQSFITEHDRELTMKRTKPLPDDAVSFLSGSKFASRRILRLLGGVKNDY